MKTTRAIAVLSLLAAVVLSACAGSRDDDGQTKLGFIAKYSNEYFLAMLDSVKQWDQAHDDVKVVTGKGANENDVDGQIASSSR